MIDYDMLFEEGNLVALKNMHEEKTYYYFVEPYVEGEDGKIDWSEYYNENLSWRGKTYYKEENKSIDTTFHIMFIAKLDFENKTVDMLYSRADGINKAIKEDKMPELKNGYFVEVENEFEEGDLEIGVVVDNHIVYKNGGWDPIGEPDSDEWGVYNDIVKIWDTTAFDYCDDTELIWKKN